MRFLLWRTAMRLKISCKLWALRGLPTCPYHGFSKQSWVTGYCRECKEIPVIPQMEETCTFCGEEKAIKQIPSPNGDKEIWSVCWECDRYLDWSMKHMLAHMAGKEIKPFDEWLFEKEKVWPKGEYLSATIRKKEK